MSFGNCFLSKALLLLWSCINGREKNGQDFQVNVCINVCSNMGPRLFFQILTRQFSKIFFFLRCICPKFQILIHVDGKEKQISEKDANISQHSLWMFCTIIFYADQRRSNWFELEWPIIRFSEGWSVSNLITWLWGGLCSFSYPNNYNTNRRNGENLQTIVSFI